MPALSASNTLSRQLLCNWANHRLCQRWLRNRKRLADVAGRSWSTRGRISSLHRSRPSPWCKDRELQHPIGTSRKATKTQRMQTLSNQKVGQLRHGHLRRASGVGEIEFPKSDTPAEDRWGWRTIGGDHPMPGEVGFQGEFLGHLRNFRLHRVRLALWSLWQEVCRARIPEVTTR
jgi:hypothetical protein